MRKLVTALCALVFLSSCDDELKLVSRDFSVTLKSIDGNTAVVGKPINCTLTISDLDPDNGDQILTRFEVRDGDGVILVDNNEYSPGETFEYDFKANNRLDFDFIPATEGGVYRHGGSQRTCDTIRQHQTESFQPGDKHTFPERAGSYAGIGGSGILFAA